MFSIINGICVFGIPVGLFLIPLIGRNGGILVGASFIILGIMFMLLPFPVDNMISKYKIKKAISLTRIIAAVLLVVGIASLICAFLLLK